MASFSEDDGVTWTPPQDLHPWMLNGAPLQTALNKPQAAIDADGRWRAVWHVWNLKLIGGNFASGSSDYDILTVQPQPTPGP
jgi:hypothetical protein